MKISSSCIHGLSVFLAGGGLVFSSCTFGTVDGETITKKITVDNAFEISTNLETIYKIKGLPGHYFSPVTGLDENREPWVNLTELTPSEPSESLSKAPQKVAPHPAIADRMAINAAMHAYDSFTDETRSILSGKRSLSALGNRQANLLQLTPPALLMASADNGAPQEDERENYFSETLGTFTAMPWFTVLQVNGYFASQDQGDKAAGYKASGYGVQGGLLTAVGEQWLLGVYMAWQKLNAEVRKAEGEVDMGAVRLGPTVTWYYDAWHVEGLVTYCWNTVNNKYGGLSKEYKSNQWDGYGRAGYDFDLSGLVPGLMLTPELQILYSHQKRKDAHLPWLASTTNNATSKGWTTRLGGQVTYDRLEFQQPVELRVSAGWEHNGFKTGELDRKGFGKLKCEYQDNNSMYFGAGVDTLLNEQFNLCVSYNGNWSSKSYAHFIQAALEFRF